MRCEEDVQTTKPRAFPWGSYRTAARQLLLTAAASASAHAHISLYMHARDIDLWIACMQQAARIGKRVFATKNI